MSSYVARCEGISLEAAIAFQEIFAFTDGNGVRRYTPFESVANPHTYFPLAVIGELGGVIDAHCKTGRRRRDYRLDAVNEAGDSFVYFLIYGLVLRDTMGESDFLIRAVEQHWDCPAVAIDNDSQLLHMYSNTVSQLSKLDDVSERTKQVFGGIFSGIRSIGEYVTQLNWQAIIDAFHYSTLDMHLDPKRYTLDFRFQGSGHIDFDKLLEWIKAQSLAGHVQVPDDLIKVFKRYSQISANQRGLL